MWRGVDPARWTGLKDLGPLALMPARFPIFTAVVKWVAGGSSGLPSHSSDATDDSRVVQDDSFVMRDSPFVV